MDKTIHVFRGLLNHRIYNRVFTSKYCVSRKDSGEKDGTSSETGQELAAQNNKIHENEIKAGDTKHKEEVELSSRSEITVNNQTTDNSDFKFVDEKAEPVNSETKSDVSLSSDVPRANEKTLGSKLEKLIHLSDVYLKTDTDIKEELQSYKEKYEAENVDAQKSKPGVSDSSESFASLLRRSAFIDLGDPVNKLVVGQIYLTVDNDLYVDFGWKFPAICSRPKVNPEVYSIGAKVLLRIKDLELTAKFLGDKEYTSLLEADCVIVHRINEDGTKYVKLNPGKTPGHL